VSGGPLVVVVGAGGGCGATTLACGLALAWSRAGRPTCLLELDLERGDLAGALGVAPERSLDDLVPVAGELAPEHLRQVAYPHGPGLVVLLGPGRAGAAADWDPDGLVRLLAAAREDRACVVDAGAGAPPPAVSAAASTVLAVAPACHAGARRARRVASAVADGRAGLVGAPPPGPPDQARGSRALGLAAGMAVRASLAHAPREAADLGAGRWPRGRRVPLSRTIAALAEEIV
jgi:hypothetical protein